MNPAASLVGELRLALKGRVDTDVRLDRFTTYRLGGPATVLIEPVDREDLEAAQPFLARLGLPLLVVGRGSNLVISDSGFPGVVVHLGGGFSWVEQGDEAVQVRSGAATALPQLANWAARRGLAGLEWAVGVPGSLGGAVRMNAGAHGTDMSASLVSALVWDTGAGGLEHLTHADLEMTYRHTCLTDRQVVLEAELELTAAEPEVIKERTEEFRKHRAATQPGAFQNAGSVFKNPPGDSAGRLVEAAGLKGFSVGGAGVSTKHANFFIAETGASSQDVFDLVAEVRARVQERFGVGLEPEIRFVGSFEPSQAKEAR